MPSKCSHQFISRKSLSDLPHGVFALNLLNQACSYRNAGERLLEDGSDFDHPSYFCLAHAVELLLKAFLVAKELKRGDLDRTHCLECLWALSAELGLQVHNVSNMAERMYAINPYSSLFRYPDIVILASIDRHEMIETFDEAFHFIQPAVIHARLNVPRGQYEVDEFTNGADLP